MENINKIIIVIPSLNPDEALIRYVEELIKAGFYKLVVVDDGSSDVYQSIFNILKNISGVHILKHDVNKGKGASLKTAYRYIKENFVDAVGILTVDSDGQHLTKDCLKIALEMLKEKRGLYLGCRDFNNPIVPWKSKCGNTLTSFLFKLLYKYELKDTQTGLRGFLMDDIDFMLSIEGDRYEYEMEVLIMMCLKKYEIFTIPIETVYINQNEGSHFRPLKDGLKIYKILFRKHNL